MIQSLIERVPTSPGQRIRGNPQPRRPRAVLASTHAMPGFSVDRVDPPLPTGASPRSLISADIVRSGRRGLVGALSEPLHLLRGRTIALKGWCPRHVSVGEPRLCAGRAGVRVDIFGALQLSLSRRCRLPYRTTCSSVSRLRRRSSGDLYAVDHVARCAHAAVDRVIPSRFRLRAAGMARSPREIHVKYDRAVRCHSGVP